MIIALVLLSLCYSEDNLHELAIAITLHLDALERMLLHLCLIFQLLAARAGEDLLLLRATVYSRAVVPGEPCAFLDVIVGIHALLDLRLVVGKQIILQIALIAWLYHVRVICKRIWLPVVIALLTISKVEEIVFSTSTIAIVNSIRPYLYLPSVHYFRKFIIKL